MNASPLLHLDSKLGVLFIWNSSRESQTLGLRIICTFVEVLCRWSCDFWCAEVRDSSLCPSGRVLWVVVEFSFPATHPAHFKRFGNAQLARLW
jgi:hypothetical protein